MQKTSIVTSFLICNNKILILKRSEKVRSMKGLWAGVSGIIENNGTNVRFICLVDSLTLIHPSLLSRVLAIRIPEIKLQDKKEYIQYVCDNFVNLTESKKKKLYEINSIFELNYRISSFISSKKKIKLNTYDDSIKSIIKYIDESNISSIINIRTICYNLLLNKRK